MVDRWMEKAGTVMPAIPNPGPNGELVVGISDGGLPFLAIVDNKLIGFEIELCERFAAHIGKKVRFSNMDFSALIAAVAAGKVDMIVSAIFITDERKQSINFSDPYYEEGDAGLRPEEEHRGLRHLRCRYRPGAAVPDQVRGELP